MKESLDKISISQLKDRKEIFQRNYKLINQQEVAMEKRSLNWMRVLMVTLLLFTTFSVSWNLLADMESADSKKTRQDLSLNDYEVFSNRSHLFSEIQNKEVPLNKEEYTDASSDKEDYSAMQEKEPFRKIQDLASKSNSSDITTQMSEVNQQENQENDELPPSGLVASLSDVFGYSIPLETEFFYPMDQTRLFADNSNSESSYKGWKDSKKEASSKENPEISKVKDCDEGIVIESSEKDGIKVEEAWYNGVNVVKAHRGLNVKHAYGEGMKVNFAHEDGFNLDSADVNGVDIDHVGDDGIQIFRAGKDGLVIYNAQEEGIDAVGDRGNLLRSNSPDFHGLYVYSYGASPSNPGLYVAGTFYATGTKSSVVQTSRGDEALYAVESPEVEFVASGSGKLINGECNITFERLFQEAISDQIPLRIILTPKDTWSGLYVAEKSHQGFQAKAVGGEDDAEFDWLAIGRRKGYEERPDSPFSR